MLREWGNLEMKQIIIVGRGHGGTRCMANTLRQSGLFMGHVNGSGDTTPGKRLYEAVKMAGDYVEFLEPYEWDFTELVEMSPPERYIELMQEYLSPQFEGKDTYGWKLPESVLALPWLVKMFPDAYYIHWVRDGRDSILSYHDTEHLDQWRIPHIVPRNSSRLLCAAVSWKYHEDMVQATPKPTHWMKVRFEDFVLRQGEELKRVGGYLDMDLTKIPVRREPVGRYVSHDLSSVIEIIQTQLEQQGYLPLRAG